MQTQPICECGCGREVARAKRPDRQARFLPGHNRRKRDAYQLEDRGYETPCWVWQDGLYPSGYARTTVDGRQMPAHRAFYEQVHGKVPRELHVDHLCRNRACVNPDHLEAVTPAENVRRGLATKLTSADVEAIRQALDEGQSRTVLAQRFGVVRNYIGKIATAQAWRDA